jgi:mono/diheme cytochrome c family protein
LICIKTANRLPWLVQTRVTIARHGELEMRGLHVWLMAALPLTAASGEAQEVGQAARGFALAQQLCAQCHAVRNDQARSPNENAPRFTVIASVPGMTGIALSAMLNTSHRSMPNIMLEADEQANIIAYILSLK